MLIYIHVPFCRSKCNYCAFHSLPTAGMDPTARGTMIQEYSDAILLELAHHGDALKGQPVESVFFGGGTPSLLPAGFIGAVMDRIGSHFSLAPKAEVTLEANPESLRDRKLLPDYLSAGVNRLSIGIQSLDDTTLRLLGRPHKAMDSMQAVYAAREAGFSNISIDLMWGLPGQSMKQWLQTLKDALRLGPDHLSAYALTLEPGTSLEKDCESGLLSLPPERDQGIMFMEGAGLLEANGFLHYEISNFARMGFQCRHNIGYWEGADYLGLGPSATSTLGDRRWTNPANLKIWQEMVAKGRPASDVEVLTPKTRVLELIMLRLRTARGLRLKAYKAMTGNDFLVDHQRLIQAMHENGLVRIRNGYLSLTRSGMLVSNSIISNLFEKTESLLDQNLKPVKPAPISGKPEPASQNPASAAMPVVWPVARRSFSKIS